MAQHNPGSRAFLLIVLGGIVIGFVIAAYLLSGNDSETGAKMDKEQPAVVAPVGEAPAEPAGNEMSDDMTPPDEMSDGVTPPDEMSDDMMPPDEMSDDLMSPDEAMPDDAMPDEAMPDEAMPDEAPDAIMPDETPEEAVPENPPPAPNP